MNDNQDQWSRERLVSALLCPPSLPLKRLYTVQDTELEQRVAAGLDIAWNRFRAEATALPRVSVILPTRDRAATLPAAIQSVLRQDYPEVELLVIDDGSRDGSATLPALDHPCVRLIRLDGAGVAAARNAGLDQATGSIIAFLDSDNRWRPRHLRDLVTALELTGAEAASNVLVLHRPDGSVRFRGEPFDHAECRRGNYVDLNVFAHRASALGNGLRFDTHLRRGVDWDFILRMTVNRPVAFVPIPGCDYSDTPDDRQRISLSEPRLYLNLVREKTRTGLPIPEILSRRRFRFTTEAPHECAPLIAALEKLGHEVQTHPGNGPHQKRPEVAVHTLATASRSLRPDLFNILTLQNNLDRFPYAALDRFDLVFTASASDAAHLTAVLRRPVVQIDSGDADSSAECILQRLRAAILAPRRKRVFFPQPALLARKRIKVGLLSQRGRRWPNASSHIRVICPLTTDMAIKQFELVELNGPEDERSRDCGILLLQRFALATPPEAERFLHNLRSSRAKLLVDSDDHPFSIGENDPRSAALLLAMERADKVHVASRALEDLHQDMGARLVPKHLEPRVWLGGHPPPAPPRTGDPLRIVYIGTPTHDADFRPVLDALNRLWLRRPEQFLVTILGALRIVPKVPWIDTRRSALPETAYPDFCQRAHALGPFHLGLAPLADTPKNNTKSDLRCLDNAALGAATLATFSPAYQHLVDAGLAYGTPHTADGWLMSLDAILDDRGALHRKALDARAWLWQERSTQTQSPLLDALHELSDTGSTRP